MGSDENRKESVIRTSQPDSRVASTCDPRVEVEPQSSLVEDTSERIFNPEGFFTSTNTPFTQPIDRSIVP